MCKTLIGGLGFLLIVEFDKDGADKFAFPSAVAVLHRGDFGNQTLELGPAPIDGIDLFANQELETMSGTVFGLDETSGD